MPEMKGVHWVVVVGPQSLNYTLATARVIQLYVTV